jgi:hypothetical protein
VVVDNGSIDDRSRWSFGARRVIHNARVSNCAIKGHAMRPANLAFVDADHEIASGWVAAALETLAWTGPARRRFCRAPPMAWVQRHTNT